MNVTKQLYQWDTGQKLTECTGIYVDYLIGDEVYRVEITDGTCIIPDELLQTSGSHTVYECMTNNTIQSFAFSVIPRPKPPEYVFTPTERLTFEGLVQKVDDAVADMIRRAESGEFDGHTPVKGTDYFTAPEIQQIQNEVSSGAIGEFKSAVNTETNKFNANATEKVNAYNQNDSEKTTSYNANATEKLNAYNSNAGTKLNAYNTNANNKVAEFDSHTEQIQTDISELKSDLTALENGGTFDLRLTFVNGYYNDFGDVTEVSWASRTELIDISNVDAIIFDGQYIDFPAGFSVFYKDGVRKYSISESSLSKETIPYTVDVTNYDAVKFSFNNSGLSNIIIKKVITGKIKNIENEIENIKEDIINSDFAPYVVPRFSYPVNEPFYIYKENITLVGNEQGITDYLANDMTEKTFVLTQPTVGEKTYSHFIYNADMSKVSTNNLVIAYKTANKNEKKVMLLGDSTIDTSPVTGISPEAKALRDAYGDNLTLIGTRGNTPYKHCGIGGWSASDWWNQQSYGSNTNPFYNPLVNHFDFGYGISQNNLIVPDVVIIQLGINDVTGATEPSRFDLLCNAYIESMQKIVDNIKAYNNSIKIYVNLIIPPSKDWSHYMAYAGAYLSPNIAKQHNLIASAKLLQELKNTDGLLPINCIIDRDNDFADRVHPNGTGYEKIGQFLSKCLSVIE